jgi:hypothetical protein
MVKSPSNFVLPGIFFILPFSIVVFADNIITHITKNKNSFTEVYVTQIRSFPI